MDSLKKTAIAQSVSKTASAILGNDFIIDETQRAQINMQVSRLMEGGNTLQEATESATKNVLKGSIDFKRLQSLKNAELTSKQASALKASSSSTGGSSAKKTIKQDKN